MGIQVWVYVGNGNQEDELLGLYSARMRLKQLCFKLKGAHRVSFLLMPAVGDHASAGGWTR